MELENERKVDNDFELHPSLQQRAPPQHAPHPNLHYTVAGDVVYGVAHLLGGGVGSALYGEDGRAICLSKPIYGLFAHPYR
nr:stress up-regulated Nod 19 [Tanacetum cinerariifolium]